jgi:hypothetical protein
MHTDVEPQDTVRMYHIGLMLMTVHGVGVLKYRWYLLFFISLCSPCPRGIHQFPLLGKILRFYCALRFLESCDILKFLDYAGNTDGRMAHDTSKGSWAVPLSISPGRRASVVCDITMNPRYFFHIVHGSFDGLGWIGHLLVASISGSSPFYILGRILDPHPITI